MNARSYLLLLAVSSLLLVSCSSAEPAGIDGFETARITIDGRELNVAVADNPTLRSQGLMDVTDLGGLDGMLFVFETSVDTGFWMKDTLIPLDIAFFDAGGASVDRFTMEPCTDDPCPVFRPSGSYRYALEAPAGDLAFVAESSTLTPPN